MLLVGSVEVNSLSYHYRADKSTIFGMRGLSGLGINSRRGPMPKYLYWKSDYLCFYTTQEALFGVKMRGFEVKESIQVGLKLIQVIGIQDVT